MRKERDSCTVLLVAPPCGFRADVASGVEKLGFTLMTVSDPSEAVASFEREAPDVVITDLFPPDHAGLALIQEIRNRGETCPVVVISAAEEGAMVAAAFRAGATDYVRKPIVTEELSRALNRARRMTAPRPAGVPGLLEFDWRFVLQSDPALAEDWALWM
ncbi:MAG: response regulator, partial [Nitrospira sp.]|nr:response regulator [Nitrospira sp.]